MTDANFGVDGRRQIMVERCLTSESASNGVVDLNGADLHQGKHALMMPPGSGKACASRKPHQIWLSLAAMFCGE